MSEQDQTPSIDLEDTEGHLQRSDENDAEGHLQRSDEDDAEGHLRRSDDEDDTEGHKYI